MQQILSIHLGGADLIRISTVSAHSGRSSVCIQDPNFGVPFQIHGSLVALARLRDALTAHLDGTDRVDIVHQWTRPLVAEASTASEDDDGEYYWGPCLRADCSGELTEVGDHLRCDHCARDYPIGEVQSAHSSCDHMGGDCRVIRRRRLAQAI